MSQPSLKTPKIWAISSLGLSQAFIVFGHKVSLLGGLGQGYILGIIAHFLFNQHIDLAKQVPKAKAGKAALAVALIATAYFGRDQDYVLGLLWGMVWFALLANWQKKLLQLPGKNAA